MLIADGAVPNVRSGRGTSSAPATVALQFGTRPTSETWEGYVGTVAVCQTKVGVYDGGGGSSQHPNAMKCELARTVAFGAAHRQKKLSQVTRGLSTIPPSTMMPCPPRHARQNRKPWFPFDRPVKTDLSVCEKQQEMHQEMMTHAKSQKSDHMTHNSLNKMTIIRNPGWHYSVQTHPTGATDGPENARSRCLNKTWDLQKMAEIPKLWPMMADLAAIQSFSRSLSSPQRCSNTKA